jgi:hypothetical protein
MSCSEEPNERCLTPCLDENRGITDSTNGITNISSPDVNLDDNLDSVTQEAPEDEQIDGKQDQEQEPTSSSTNVALNKSGSSGFDPIEGVSDISDEEDENLRSAEIVDEKEEEKCNKGKSSDIGQNSKSHKQSNFKKITPNTRERNYRDRMKKKPYPPAQRPPHMEMRPYRGKIDDRPPYNRYDKRREIVRYNVRNIVAGRKNLPRDYSRSRSRSRSYSPKRIRRSNTRSPSPNYPRNMQRARSPYQRASPRPIRKVTPSYSHSPSLSLSPPPPSHRYRSRSMSPPVSIHGKYTRPRTKSRSRSHERIEKFYRRRSRTPKKKKKEGRKRKKSRTRSRSIRASPESQISSRSLSVESGRQIINNVDAAWPPGKPGTENLKVILKNSEAIAKKKSKKKREKKRDGKKKPKELRVKRPEKIGVDGPEVASKEVFASGDNILVSVSFNNNNNKSKDDEHLLSEPALQVSKTKRRKPSLSPNSTQSMSGETDGEPEKRHRKKKGRNKKEKPKQSETSVSTPTTKRKSDMKPIAIIVLDKSPIKEIGSPKDVIVLSDSDAENKKHQKNHQMKESLNLVLDDSQKTPNIRVTTPPESPSPQIQNAAPTIQFSFQLKSKPQILPFNPAFVHEQDEDEEELKETNKGPAEPPGPSPKNQDETGKPVKSPDAYDPFEPTKSGSNSPSSFTPPRANDVTSSSDMLKEAGSELPDGQQQKNLEDGLITSSIWTKKDVDKKQPCTPPLPASPSPVFQPPVQPKAGTISLYSPAALQSNSDKAPDLADDLDGSGSKDMSVDLKSPYSPSSDDYNDLFEPPEPSPPPPITQRTPSTYIDTTSVINLTGKGGISSFETVKLNVDYDKNSGVAGKSGYGSSSNYFTKSNEPKKTLTLTASTLKTFNSQRSNLTQTNIFSKMGLNFVNKNETNVIENFVRSPAGLPIGSTGTITNTQTNSQQKGGRTTSSFTRTKNTKFSKVNEPNGSPPRHSSSYHYDSFKGECCLV